MSDAIEFDDFYTGTSRRVLGQVYAMVGRLGDAEDAVQEAYCRAWQRWEVLRGYEDPEGWVRTVAYRVAVSTWRKLTNQLVAHRRHGPPNDLPGLGPEHVALVEALGTLPLERRRAVVLHHLVGLSIEEIARETRSPVGTVKSRLARGRQALAAAIGDETRPRATNGTKDGA